MSGFFWQRRAAAAAAAAAVVALAGGRLKKVARGAVVLLVLFLLLFLALPPGRGAASVLQGAPKGVLSGMPGETPGTGRGTGTGIGTGIGAETGAGGSAAAGPVRRLTLEQAKELAREAGPTLRRVEIELGLAESAVAMARRSAGIGSYYDSRALKRDMDELEKHIDGKLEAIAGLEQQLGVWRKEKEELEREGAKEPGAVSRLEAAMEKAHREKAELEEGLLALRRAYAQMVPRYYQMKAAEEAVRPTLDPLELARDAARDQASVQPELLDYQVESLYLSLFSLQGREAYQALLLENQRRMLRREQLLLELGLSTALRLAQAEAAVKQVAEAGERLRAEKERLKRDFALLLGLPLEDAFELAPVPEAYLAVEERRERELWEAPAPDLRQSLSYRRALEVLQRRQKDLEETSRSETQKYRQAVLNVEKAQLDLALTLDSLQAAYRGARERLAVTGLERQNSSLLLQHAAESLTAAELKYKLGTISLVELERQELAYKEAALNHQAALQGHYLAYRAYLLAREGILP